MPRPLGAALLGGEFVSGASPNILWILTTQWRGQALGVAGDPNARTPSLDAFAGTSVCYEAAITPHPFGPFARAAILTGRPCPENGIAGYFDPLPRGTETAAHRFAASGYATAFFGKWHLAPRDPGAPLVGEAHARATVHPADRGGFAFWEGFESGFLLNDPWLHGTGHAQPRRYHGYQSDVLVERLLAWHRSRAASPWFAVLSLEPPHPPYAAPAGGIPPPDPASLRLRGNVPLGGEIETRARHDLAGYYAHLTATDAALGRAMAALPGDTVIVFTSVHGDMHGSHGLFRKGWPYEESIRVPLFIRSPGVAAARVPHPVSLLELERLTRDPGSAPAGPVTCSMPSVVALPDQCDRVWHAVRTATGKLVWDGTSPDPWLAFDLAADPLEQENRAPPRPADGLSARETDAGLPPPPPAA